MEQAFQKAKMALSGAAFLAHPQSEPELSLAVDTSNHQMGGALQQKCGAGWQPLAFFHGSGTLQISSTVLRDIPVVMF